MARTDKLKQSQIMLDAGQSGEAARQRSHESRISSSHRRADRAQQQSQFEEGIEQQNLDRWQRQWEQRRAERERRDQERAANQAAKPRTTNFGTEGRDPGGVVDPKLEENKRQFDQQMAEKQRQFDTSTELSAATHGLQRGGGVAGGNPGPDNPRLQALQQEMQQRSEKQMGMGVESKGRRGFVPTPEAKEAAKRSAQLDERAMQAKELTAAASWQRAVTAQQKATADVKAATTSAGRKEAEAKQKAAEESLEQPIKSDAARLDRFIKGDQTESVLQTLLSMLKNLLPVGVARDIHDEANRGEVGPAVTRFLSEKVAASAIQYIYATGKLPDGKLVDMSSAGMQEFSRRAIEARGLLLPNTVAGQLLTDKQISKVKRGYSDHLEMVHKLAALLVMKQQPGMASAALGGQQEPTHEQRRADPTRPPTPAERAGQITPEEAGRRAEEGGGTAAPATGKKPYKPGRSPGPMGVRGGVSGNLPYGV